MKPIKITSRYCYGTLFWVDTINYNAVCVKSNNEVTLINIKDIKVKELSCFNNE